MAHTIDQILAANRVAGDLEACDTRVRYDQAQRLIGEHQRHASLAGESGWQWQHQHTLIANGAPQASQFGDLPALNWHTYGSGHLHGMSAPGLDLEIALEPDALHRETQRRLSTGANAHNQPLVLERGYTNLGQLDHLTLRSPDTTSQQSYQYDALGRMSFRSLQGDPAENVIAYSYDAAGRLIGSQHGDHAHRYSVDAAGNRLEQGVDKQQGLTDNRLTQLNGTRYRYDGAGNLIERQQPNGERLTLGYDGANRLVHLIHASELGATREATYRYDGLGRRISKTVRHPNGTTATTHYGWDGDRIVREETDNQRTTMVYEPGSFVPMLRVDDTEQGQVLSAYITDALGTPMQLVTPNGQPRWLAEPDDWAAVKNQRAVRNLTQPIRFQGQWHDEESGLYYNRHRYYDPQQGRYISQDPIGLRGGVNMYQYSVAPSIEVDPQGLSGVYGLGGGPYSQSNTVSRAAENIVITGEGNASVETFGGVFGQTVSTGLKFDNVGNAAWVMTECQQYGLGMFRGAGVGGNASVGSAPLEDGVSETWGPFVRGAVIKGGGASIDVGGGALAGASGWLGPSFGLAGGIQHCKTTTTVLRKGDREK